MPDYWVSTSWSTGRVTVDEQGVIIDVPCIWYKAIGETFDYFLSRYLRGDVQYVELPEQRR